MTAEQTPEAAAGDDGRPDQKNVVGSLLKACRLMECFTQERPELTLGDLAAHTELNKTTVHRLLQTLVMAGWLVRGQGGTYHVAMRVFRVGSTATVGLDVRTQALPILRRLADRFGDTAYLMVPTPDGALCVELCEGASPVKISSIGIGTVLPYHAAAAPIVMVAYDDELAERVLAGDLKPFTSRTVVDAEALAERLGQVRAQGYAISEDDYLDGVSAVGAPVFGAEGDVVATVSLGGTSNHFRGDRLLEVLECVTAAASELSQQLGY